MGNDYEEFSRLVDEYYEEEKREKKRKEVRVYMKIFIDVLEDVGINGALFYGYLHSMIDLSTKTNLIDKSEGRKERFKDEFGTFCACSVKNIMYFTKLGEKPLRKAKKELIEKGYIKEVRRKDKSNKFYILK